LTDLVRTGTPPPRPLSLRDERGGVIAGNGQRWLEAAASEDERLLDWAVEPVLDVGCGPGRHLVALTRRGVTCLGIDVTPSAVRLARSRGATVVQGSIFGPVPGARMWATALLLDGNIGIGGDPVALLARVASMLRPGGRILVELGPPGTSGAPELARVEHGAHTGPWFAWVAVGASHIGGIAAAAGLRLTRSWSAGGRWFAHVDTPDRRAAVGLGSLLPTRRH